MSVQDASRPQIHSEQNPEQRPDCLNLKSFLDVQGRYNRRASQLLALIDELDRRIAAGVGHRRTQEQARRNAGQKFAVHMDNNPSPVRQLFYTTDDGREVFIAFDVLGNPSRTAIKQAEGWMAARGRNWTGNSKTLRASVLNALQRGEKLPAGNFGLRVERTIRIVNETADGFRAELPNSFKSK